MSFKFKSAKQFGCFEFQQNQRNVDGNSVKVSCCFKTDQTQGCILFDTEFFLEKSISTRKQTLLVHHEFLANNGMIIVDIILKCINSMQ